MVCAASACSGSSHSDSGGTASPASTGSPASTESTAAGPGASWTTYHEDAEATGVQPAQLQLLPSRKAWTSPVLDGQLFGEPLVADGRIVAATENDTVYVLAARSGQILWSRHLASPCRPATCRAVTSRPWSASPAPRSIDLARHEIFVDADTLVKGPASSNGVEASHRLFGLDLFTGKVELSEPAMPSAGEDQLAELQRPGLGARRRPRSHRLRPERRRLPRPERPCPRLCRLDPRDGRTAATTSRSAAARTGERCGWAAPRRSSTRRGTSTWPAPRLEPRRRPAVRRQRRGARAVAGDAARVDLLPRRTGSSSDSGATSTSEPETPCSWTASCSRSARRTTRTCCARDTSVARTARSPRCRCAAATPTVDTRSTGLGRLRTLPVRRDGDQGFGEGAVPEAAMD